MDKQKAKQDQLWQQCPKGMLLQVAARGSEQNRTRNTSGEANQFDRRRMLQIAAAVAVSAGAGTIAYRSLFPPVSSKGYGGISCVTCIKHLDKYIQQALEDQQLAAQMEKHLELCKGCRAKYDMRRNA